MRVAYATCDPHSSWTQPMRRQGMCLWTARTSGNLAATSQSDAFGRKVCLCVVTHKQVSRQLVD